MTEKAGLYDPTSKALGVALIDYDNDGWLDLFVSNDTEPNKLYHNNNGTFTDVAVAAGVAFGEAGTTSQSELSLTLGMGRPAHGKDVNVKVIWPSGRRDSVTNAKPNQFIIIEEGTGLSVTATIPTFMPKVMLMS